MLLKAEVLETRLAIKYGHGFDKLSLTKPTGTVTLSLSKGCRSDKSFIAYQNLIAKLYELGYREIPKNMKNLLIRTYTMDSVRAMQAKVYDGKTRYASLSWGMFDEAHDIKPTELYNHTVFNTTTKKIERFTPPDDGSSYNFDPIVFALNVDPLTAKFPGISPYAAMANDPINNVDLTGETPNPIRIAWDYLHRSFIPNFTAGLIVEYAKNVGFQPNTCNICRLGRICQGAVTGSLGEEENQRTLK